MEEKGKKLGLWNIIGLGLGGAIGTGIFVLLGYGIAYTGRSISLVVAIGCFFMLLAYWYNLAMPAMFVMKGGDYSMKAMLFNPFMSGVSAWMILVNGLAMSSYSVALAQYLAIAIITLVLVASLVIFVVFGLPKVDFANTFSSADGGFFHGGFTGFVSALAVMGWACQGTTMAPVSMAAVTKNPKRTIPLGIIIITLLLAVIYGTMGIVAGGVLPYVETAGQNISVTAEAILPRALYIFFVVGGGIGAIASSALGGLGMFRYPLLQVASDGWLPSVFKKTDKNGYPYVIYLLFYVISIIPILTGRSLDAIVSQVMIPTMLINIYMNLTCLVLPKKYPEQWAQRSIKMPLWFYNVCCVLGAFCAGVVAFNLFKDLTFNDAVFTVVIVAVMCVLTIVRLKQGAVKAEDLAAKKEEIVRQAIADTTADEAEAA